MSLPNHDSRYLLLEDSLEDRKKFATDSLYQRKIVESYSSGMFDAAVDEARRLAKVSGKRYAVLELRFEVEGPPPVPPPINERRYP